MVVPLVIGIFGEDWVMYVTCYSIVQTILVWTHARILISGKKEISLRDLVCNVNILAIVDTCIYFGNLGTEIIHAFPELCQGRVFAAAC